MLELVFQEFFFFDRFFPNIGFSEFYFEFLFFRAFYIILLKQRVTLTKFRDVIGFPYRVIWSEVRL